ncbi:MAG: DUF5990 family protein [Micromonosporaceae bacterium]
MPQLPSRPNLDQLRRQARQLHRAAVDGDRASLSALWSVSDHLTLSSAQLAIAREYGFPSWSRLKAEVERRRAAGTGTAGTGAAGTGAAGTGAAGAASSDAAGTGAAVGAVGSDAGRDASSSSAEGAPAPLAPPTVKSWNEVREWSASLLLARTGHDVAEWNQRVAGTGLGDEHALRAWLAEQGVTGYAQALLVWERFGYPGFLTADADHLITAQYDDRPHLRHVLDAVLAALPALGPVTVQARKTYISLVSPRRTFAVVQATTKKRVDLGLRLENAEPAGRLQAAKNIGNGSATVRIALTEPGDIDDEVLGLLRRAYDENTAAPAPRRPARRPAPALGPMTVVIEGFDPPGLTCKPEPDGSGHQNVHVALYSRAKDRPALVIVPSGPWLATEPVPGDSPSARWEFPVTVRRGTEGFDFGGPFVRGDRTDRHIGLAWGDVPRDGTLRLFRGAKLRFADIDPGLIEEAMRPGRRLFARVRLTDAKGNPVCARVRPPGVVWSAVLAEPLS